MNENFKAGLVEHAEERGKISMSSIPNGKFQEVITFLEAEGYVCSISPNTDHLIVEKNR